jgi:1,4-dihydroxy-2-naphthoate octaprenyltransferase
VFLYGGANAFNTYYDRDTGPIGGLERPPPVRPELLPWSVGLQLAGLAAAPLVGWAFTALYAVLLLVFTAYSHPAVRLKRHAWISLATIGLAQGGIAFAAGWVSTAPAGGGSPAGLPAYGGLPGESAASAGVAALGAPAAWGFVSAVLIVAALYPLSQIYQTGEDSSRGEETLGVVLGRAGALGLTMALLVPGLGAAALAGWERFGVAWTALLLVYGTAFLTTLIASRRRLTETAAGPAFRRVMALNYVNSTAFLLFIGIQLLRA